MADPILTNIKQSLAPEYQQFLDSGYTDAIAMKINERHQLEESQVVVVRNGFDLYLHFLVDQAELVEFLTEEAAIETDTAKSIADAFIADLPEQLVAGHKEMYDALRNPPEPSGADTAVQSVRTMAGDVAAAQSDSVQSISQDDLLKQPNPDHPGSDDKPTA